MELVFHQHFHMRAIKHAPVAHVARTLAGKLEPFSTHHPNPGSATQQVSQCERLWDRDRKCIMGQNMLGVGRIRAREALEVFWIISFSAASTPLILRLESAKDLL